MYFVGEYKADDIPINDTDWNVLETDPTSVIKVNTDGIDNRIGFAKRISRNIVSSKSNIELMFNRDQPIK